jgi:hypothetical protein
MVIGILRIVVGVDELDLRRSMLETLSHILYRIYYNYIIASSDMSITGKIVVQVDAQRDARSFLMGAGA